jgi:hypothetical protein
MAALTSAADIPPGGEAAIEATLHTRGRSGELTKMVTVETSDPSRSLVRLRLQGTVLVSLGFVPPYLSLGRLTRGEEVEQTATLVARDEAEISIVGIEVLGATGNLDAKQTTVEGRPALQVTYRAAKIGPIGARIRVTTNSKKRPTLDLMVRGRVDGNWKVMPRAVHFPAPAADSADEPQLRKLVIEPRKNTRFKLVNAADNTDAVAVSLSKKGSGYEVALRLKKAPSNGRGTIEIQTNDPDEPVIRTHYYVRRAPIGPPAGKATQ